MRRILALVLLAAGPLTLGLSSSGLAQIASAQSPEYPLAPAMNLEEVQPPAGAPRLTLRNARGHVAHIFPTVRQRAMLAPVHNGDYFGGDPPVVYHAGGSVITNVTIYNIFWAPPTLQDGTSTSLPAAYQSLMTRLMTDYPGHGIDNNNTQYFQTIGKTTTYIKSAGGFGAAYVDTSAYPASGCTDSATPNDCITDAQIQAEILKVMGIKKWTGGLTKIFVLYTSTGEGSCFDSTSTSCAYTDYCAYHSFISGTPDTIYANIPYGNTTNCQLPGIPSPNANPDADAAMTAAMHETTESITDPLLNAWFTATLGYEVADLCAYDYGNSDSGTFNTYDGNLANQSWNGHYYELQTIFDNHAFAVTGGVNGCVLTGPFSLAPSSGYP